MVVIRTCTFFFFEVPRIEELQDPDSSPRREEVGRRTLRGLWRLPTLVFLSGKVSIVHAAFSSVCREASKTITDKPPDTSGVEESNSPRKVLHD